MARSRSDIGAYVHRNTGRSMNVNQINDFCNEALRIALNAHPFSDAVTIESISISEGSTYVDISSIEDIIHIIAVQAVDTSGDRNRPIIMKDKVWWNRNVAERDSRLSSWPVYGHKFGTVIELDCAANRDLTIKIIVSTIQKYGDLSAAGPIEDLDVFVGQYVTAMAFLSLQDDQSYQRWKNVALGPRWESGEIGGSLANAISSDKFDLSLEMRAEKYSADGRAGGLSVQNLDSDHNDYNNIRSWY